MKLPVSCTNVASVVCRNATAIDYYSKNQEAYAGDDFHCTEKEFDLLNQLIPQKTFDELTSP